jgi:hypothetical protein
MRKGGPHAFLTAYGGGHIAMILPICAALRKLGWNVTLLALTTAAAKAEQAGEPFIGYADLLHHAAPNALAFANAICPNPHPTGPVSQAETLAYHGANFAELVERSGESAAWQQWEDNSRQAFLPVNFMQRVLAELAPDIVIATNSPRTERAAIVAAARLGIPSLCMVDMFALHEVKWISKPNFANRITVLNEAVRQMFIDHGRQPNEIVVTGNPAFDIINKKSTISLGKNLRKAKNWDDDRLTILWASNIEPPRHPFTGQIGNTQLPRLIEEKLRHIVRTNDKLRLVVRYHPNEQVQFVTERNVEFSNSSDPLHPLLHAVDFVVVSTSTVGLEAWIAQKPVISVDNSIFTDDAPFARMNISLGVKSIDELEVVFKKVLTGQPLLQKTYYDSFARAPASATSAILGVISQIHSTIQYHRK